MIFDILLFTFRLFLFLDNSLLIRNHMTAYCNMPKYPVNDHMNEIILSESPCNQKNTAAAALTGLCTCHSLSHIKN